MPRDLYHLEGQQLRGLLERLTRAELMLGHRYATGPIKANICEAHEILAQILADGPQSRDEED